MSKYVLDASALLALLQQEHGASRVEEILPFACVSSVNHAEVLCKLVDAGLEAQDAIGRLDGLELRVVPFDKESSVVSASLRDATRAAGLSFGDRACLALAVTLRIPAVTADRQWAKITGIGDIELLRGGRNT